MKKNLIKMRYKVVLLEDEPPAQENFKKLLAREIDLELCGVAQTLQEADDLCATFKPDLVFSDVIIHSHTSFDWLQKLRNIPFELIFITSYEEFAVRAFRLSAIDYLVKPIDPNDFHEAVLRFKEKRGNTKDQIQNFLQNLNRDQQSAKVALPTLSGYLFVPVREIIHCESDNTYTTFFLEGKKKVLVSKTLKEVEAMLEPFRFFRIHNSNLINLDYLTEYLKGEGGQVRLSDGTIIDVSRRRKEEFLERIRGHSK